MFHPIFAGDQSKIVAVFDTVFKSVPSRASGLDQLPRELTDGANSLWLRLNCGIDVAEAPEGIASMISGTQHLHFVV